MQNGGNILIANLGSIRSLLYQIILHLRLLFNESILIDRRKKGENETMLLIKAEIRIKMVKE